MTSDERYALYKSERFVEDAIESDKWMVELPYVPMKSDWLVKPTANFAGSTARFRVTTKARGHKGSVSIYFDAYDRLGVCDGPYWEVYPVNGDTERFLLGEEDELVDAIERAFKEAI
jgi:hypothetical protein